MISFRLQRKQRNCRGYVPSYERMPKNGWFDIHSVFATQEEKEQLTSQVNQLNTSLQEKEEEILEKDNAINTSESLYRNALKKIQQLEASGKKPDEQLIKTTQKLERQLKKEKERRENILQEKNSIKKELLDAQTNLEQSAEKYKLLEQENQSHLTRIQKLSEEMQTKQVRILQNDEIVEEFYRMILEAQTCVYMMFPKLSYPSYDGQSNAFTRTVNILQEAFKKNPRLHVVIYYGMADAGDDKIMRQAQKAIRSYEQILGANRVSFEPTNTHIKLAIADKKKFLLGSMNLLSSWNWEENKDLHSEVALLSSDSAVIEELMAKYFDKYR